MRVVQIEDAGIDGLRLAERPEPPLGDGQVRVRIRAVSLNYRDLNMAKMAHARGLRLPFLPCSDGAGEVLEVGAGVTRVSPGDRVAGIFLQGWLAGGIRPAHEPTALGGGIEGMLAEQVVLSQEGLVPVPGHMTLEEAATLPCAAITAWQALITEGRIAAGETILVQGTGGVSIFGLQIGVLSGARVIVTSSSDAKLERARELGAAGLINYRTTPDWDQRALELTGGLGVDHVVEVGGAGTLERSFRAVRLGGTISLIGLLSGAHQINPMGILFRRATVRGIYVGSREMFEAMNRAFTRHHTHPIIDRVFPLEEAREAFRYLESGAHFGKIVITL